jgi:hypothetical protein
MNGTRLLPTLAQPKISWSARKGSLCSHGKRLDLAGYFVSIRGDGSQTFCVDFFLISFSVSLLPKIGSVNDWDATTLASEIEKILLAATKERKYL